MSMDRILCESKEIEAAYRDLGTVERKYPDNGMSDRNVRIILRDLARRVQHLEQQIVQQRVQEWAHDRGYRPAGVECKRLRGPDDVGPDCGCRGEACALERWPK